MTEKLPEHVLSILKYNDYDIVPSESLISVTSLIDAPNIRKLSLKYPEEQVDPESIVTAMYGSIGHTIVERSNNRTIRELRIDHKIRKNGKYITVTGKFDNYDPKTKILYDNKFVHHNSLKYPTTKSKWEQQLNVYAFLMKEEFGWDVEKLIVIAWIRDMTAIDVVKADYPDAMVVPIELELWDYEKQHKFVNDRLDYHYEFKGIGCTSSERWATEQTWSVVKEGALRAYRNFTDKKEAAKLLLKLREKGKKYNIEFRRPTDRRCGSCKVKNKCQYHINKIVEKYRGVLKDI